MPGTDPKPLKGKAVFLSASGPHVMRDQFTPINLAEVDVVIRAVTQCVLRSGATLVFGGHPTVAPLIHQASRRALPPALEVRQQRIAEGTHPVCMYLSAAFPDSTIPGYVHRMIDEGWVDVRKIEAVGGERADFDAHGNLKPESVTASLELFRGRMLGHPGLAAAIFAGGMRGVVNEFKTLRQKFGEKWPAYAFARPGGAAQYLSEAEDLDERANLHFADETKEFLSSIGDPIFGDGYLFLAQQIIQDIERRTATG